MPTMDELHAANANFEEQMTAWRQQRYADGENPWTGRPSASTCARSAPPIREKRRRTSSTAGTSP